MSARDEGATSSGERSVAVGVNHGIISTGDNAQNVQVTLPAGLPDHVRVPAPPGTALLGGSRGAGVFVGREAELGRLASADGGAQVLVGLGGSGKTTLARRFAEQRRDRDNPVWWIDGRTSASIETGLADLAVRLDPLFDGLRALARTGRVPGSPHTATGYWCWTTCRARTRSGS